MTAIPPIKGVKRIRSAVISKTTQVEINFFDWILFLNKVSTTITSQAILNTPQTSFGARQCVFQIPSAHQLLCYK